MVVVVLMLLFPFLKELVKQARVMLLLKLSNMTSRTLAIIMLVIFRMEIVINSYAKIHMPTSSGSLVTVIKRTATWRTESGVTSSLFFL